MVFYGIMVWFYDIFMVIYGNMVYNLWYFIFLWLHLLAYQTIIFKHSSGQALRICMGDEWSSPDLRQCVHPDIMNISLQVKYFLKTFN